MYWYPIRGTSWYNITTEFEDGLFMCSNGTYLRHNMCLRYRKPGDLEVWSFDLKWKSE